MKSIDAKTFRIIDDNSKAEDKDYFYEYIDYNLKKTKK